MIISTESHMCVCERHVSIDHRLPTLGGFADFGLHLPQPLDLGVQGSGAPNRLTQPFGYEVLPVQRRGPGDGEVGAVVERGVLRL
jgi:hypothetical protein